VAAVAVAGGAVPVLRRVSVFAVRSGDGPQGVPVNKSAAAAHITDEMVGPAYRLEVVHGDQRVSLTREDLRGMTQRTQSLPIACVEGWSAGAVWTGVRVRDLLDLVDAPRGRDVDVHSLQPSGPYTHTVLHGNFADDDRTLVALALHGQPLDRDHGEPARLIAPDRPGVLQTKWLSRLEVAA
jgi:DMSO/TMAO reductase YedYZ molybdopterin-dependent catalytic subunit